MWTICSCVIVIMGECMVVVVGGGGGGGGWRRREYTYIQCICPEEIRNALLVQLTTAE